MFRCRMMTTPTPSTYHLSFHHLRFLSPLTPLRPRQLGLTILLMTLILLFSLLMPLFMTILLLSLVLLPCFRFLPPTMHTTGNHAGNSILHTEAPRFLSTRLWILLLFANATRMIAQRSNKRPSVLLTFHHVLLRYHLLSYPPGMGGLLIQTKTIIVMTMRMALPKMMIQALHTVSSRMPPRHLTTQTGLPNLKHFSEAIPTLLPRLIPSDAPPYAATSDPPPDPTLTCSLATITDAVDSSTHLFSTHEVPTPRKPNLTDAPVSTFGKILDLNLDGLSNMIAQQITYLVQLDHLNTDASDDDADAKTWRCIRIQKHRVYKNKTKRLVFVKAEWASGSTSWVQLQAMLLHDPFVLIQYAYDHFLLKQSNWKWVSPMVADTEKFHKVFRAHTAAVCTAPRFKFGLELPRGLAHAF